MAREVLAVLEADLDRIAWPPPCLTHDDFWPGNTVWYRGRLSGVIDWTLAKLGDPRADVAYCRIDITFSNTIDLADAFAAAYERDAPSPLPDLWYFDLYRGLTALFYYELYLRGYHDAGLTHLQTPEVLARLRAFLRRALAQRP